jgi:hypothetical protein
MVLVFRLLVVVLLLVVVGCSRPANRGFLQKSHRELFLIEPAELRRLQFYVSNDIVVQNQAAGGASTEDVIIMRAGTPGAVMAVGDNWLRVSFQEGGRGVPFVTDLTRKEDRYWFATEVDGRVGYHKMFTLPEQVLVLDGERYRVMEGADSFLLVDGPQIEKLIEGRRHLTGRKAEN